jgi:plastocyanin
VLAAATLCPADAPEERRPRAGSLRGTVVVGAEIEHRRVHFPLYADLSRQAPMKTVPSLQDEIRSVVVYVESVGGRRSGGPSVAPPLVMRQVNEAFEPHVLPVLVGSEVEFPNSDPFFHNVFSLSTASAFDLGHYPAGDTRSVLFDKPGLVKVFCHLHSDMSAVILVLENPYFTVPDGEGVYAIGDLPPGAYTVVAWHERARRVSRSVEIAAGAVTSLDFQIPIRDEPGSK